MKIIPLANIANKEDGDTISAINATIKKIFKAREGTGSNNKPYKFQDIFLEEGDLEVKCTLSGCDTIDAKREGEKIVITCSETKRGLTGIKAKWDDYVPDTAPKGYEGQMIIWVTPSAEIAYEGLPNSDRRQDSDSGSSGGDDGDRGESRSAAPAAPTAGRFSSKSDAILHCKKTFARAANLMVLALESVEYVSKVLAHEKKEPLSAEQKEHMASTLFIEAAKQGLMRDMPVVNLITFDPSADSEAAKKAEEDRKKAEEEAKAKKAEEKRKKAEEAKNKAASGAGAGASRKRVEENLDDDVPF